jgi:hypothetical protein
MRSSLAGAGRVNEVKEVKPGPGSPGLGSGAFVPGRSRPGERSERSEARPGKYRAGLCVRPWVGRKAPCVAVPRVASRNGESRMVALRWGWQVRAGQVNEVNEVKGCAGKVRSRRPVLPGGPLVPKPASFTFRSSKLS